MLKETLKAKILAQFQSLIYCRLPPYSSLFFSCLLKTLASLERTLTAVRSLGCFGSLWCLCFLRSRVCPVILDCGPSIQALPQISQCLLRIFLINHISFHCMSRRALRQVANNFVDTVFPRFVFPASRGGRNCAALAFDQLVGFGEG
jgi:hypothetical protein